MPQHTVKKGESRSLIAKNNGIDDWRVIYDHEKNAEFRKKRPDPNLIYENDSVFVPEKKPNKNAADGGTNQAHPFKKKGSKGVWNLKWEPAEGQFGELAKAKLTGDTSIA